ncbi:MAG: MFS transporter [Burkholderiales bacterium]
MTGAGSSLEQLQARHGQRYRWLLLLAVMAGTMASIMSSTIVNVAIPDLSHYFSLSPSRAQWVSSGFMVAMTVSMLTTPWLLARFGARRTYVGAMLLLMAGGLLGGVADWFALVLVARVAEGLAAGVVQPIPAIVILRQFKPNEQGRATGLFGMGVVLAPAIGPSVGGLLVEWFGWRSIFFMVVPFCLLSIWMARRYLPTSGPGGTPPGAGATRFDLPGLLLATFGTLCLLNGLVEARAGHGGLAAALLTLAAATLIGFVLRQKRLSDAAGAGGGKSPGSNAADRSHNRSTSEPLMNLAVFATRPFAMGSIVAFIYGAALFGSTYLLPVYLQLGLGLSAAHVGTIFLPAGLALAVTIALAGRLADRQPTWLLVSIGLALLAASFALMPIVRLDSAIWVVVLLTTIGRIGLGFILPSLNLGSLRPLPGELLSQGSSVINFMRMLGGAAGVSVCGIVLEWRIAAHGATLAQGAPDAARLAAFNESFLMLAGVCALALVAASQLRARKGRE